MNTPEMGDPKDWESRWHDSKLTLMLTPPSHGWIYMALMGTPRGNLTEVHFSYCSNDFHEIMDWVQKVAAAKLPATFEMNEEGPTVRFLALPVPERPDWIELRITRSSVEEEENRTPGKMQFRCRLERRQMVNEFWRRWDQWIREDYNANAWTNRSPNDPEQSDKPFSDEHTLEILGVLRKYLKSTAPRHT